MAEEPAKTPEPPAEAAPDVIVAVEPETPPAKAAEAKPPVDEAVSDLAAQYKKIEEASRERDEALAQAARAKAEAETARRETQQAQHRAAVSDLDSVTSALASAQAEIDNAKQAFVAARNSGDAQGEIDATERLTKATTLAQRYDEAKADLESRAKRAQQQPQRQVSTDPVEAFVANRTEPTAKWLREHKEFILDPRKNNKLTGAHYSAIGEGLEPDTKAYFDHVEKVLGLAEEKKPAEEKKAAPSRPVAPVGAGSSNGGAMDGNSVKLTAGEAQRATDGTHIWNYDDPSGQKKFKKGDPIGIQEFARRKLKLQQQGAYDRTYETQ